LLPCATIWLCAASHNPRLLCGINTGTGGSHAAFSGVLPDLIKAIA